jgi:hypothetical protein
MQSHIFRSLLDEEIWDKFAAPREELAAFGECTDAVDLGGGEKGEAQLGEIRRAQACREERFRGHQRLL